MDPNANNPCQLCTQLVTVDGGLLTSVNLQIHFDSQDMLVVNGSAIRDGQTVAFNEFKFDDLASTLRGDIITDFDVNEDAIELYYRTQDNHTNSDLNLTNGILTWDVDSTSNDVVIDLSATTNSSDLNDLDALITFVEIV